MSTAGACPKCHRPFNEGNSPNAEECNGTDDDEGLCEAYAKVAALRAQLPEGMQNCTIRFKSCHKGHGWLTADNWVQHGCPTCERDALRARAKRAEAEVKRLTS